MDKILVIIDHPVPVKADRMAMWKRDPVVERRRGLPGLAKMVFANQRGLVAIGLQPLRKRFKFANSIPLIRPFPLKTIIQPGVNTMGGRHQAGQDRCATG